jgi:hypothetical protein
VNDLHLADPRSYRYDPSRNHNWAVIRRQMAAMKPDFLLNGGDMTRDGDTHESEYQACKEDLETLPFPTFTIPGNMDVGNKHAKKEFTRNKPHRRTDRELNMTSERLALFCSTFGPPCWTFVHKEVRFSGFFAALAGSGLPQEERLWRFLERLPTLPAARHHVVMTHYTLFVDDMHEPTWDPANPDQYAAWYFNIDRPHRLRIFELMTAAHVHIALSGHIHCRRPVQVVDGVRFYKTPAGGGHAQFTDRWDDGDGTVGFHRFDVSDDGIDGVFVPCEDFKGPGDADGYGPGGHPTLSTRDYSLARQTPSLESEARSALENP